MKRLIWTGLSVLAIALATPACQATTATADSTQSPVVSETTSTIVSQQAIEVLKAGLFESGEHPTSGNVQIITENGQRYVEFGEDFQTDAGPDLVVILHRSADVIGTTSAPAHSINEGDYVTLAPLQNTSGTQRYLIPETVNLEDYSSVAVWCRQFNATFGAAALSS